MRILVQRVLQASCTVDEKITGAIESGMCLFVGFEQNDTEEIMEKMVKKLVSLRIFDDGQGRMNKNILQAKGSFLSISQFTLYADLKGQNRPGFTRAMDYKKAVKFYERFNELLKDTDIYTATGIFGADMKIALVNDGPVTIWLDSKELFGV